MLCNILLLQRSLILKLRYHLLRVTEALMDKNMNSRTQRNQYNMDQLIYAHDGNSCQGGEIVDFCDPKLVLGLYST